jgi:hypothetical protein
MLHWVSRLIEALPRVFATNEMLPLLLYRAVVPLLPLAQALATNGFGARLSEASATAVLT